MVAMAESVMINVRLKADEVSRLDAVARKLNLTRSDLIRKALSETVTKYSGEETVITGVGVRGKAKPDKKACPHAFVKTATGIKVCQICGMKRG